MHSDPPGGKTSPTQSRDLAPGAGLAPAAFAALAPPYTGEPPPSAHRRLWGLLVRRRWTLAAAVLTALLVTLGAGLLATPVYRSAVLLEIEPEPAPQTHPADAPATANQAPAPATPRDYFQTQCALLRSRTLARRVIDQLDLATSPALAPATGWPRLRDLVERLRALVPGLAPAPAPEHGEAAAAADLEDRFLARLSVTPVADSRLVRVAFDSPDPEEAAALVQTLAENFVTGSLKRRHQASAPARAFLEHRLRRAQGELAAAERRLSAVARDLGIVDLDGQHALLMERLRALEQARSAAELARLAPATRAGHTAVDAPADAAGGAGPALESLEERKAALTAEYQEQLKVFKPGYPKVQQLRRQIAEVERQLRARAAAAESAARAEASARAEQEARLVARTQALKEELQDLAERGDGYRVLAREVERHRRIHDGLLARLAEVRAHADPGPNPIAIIDRAQVPAHPIRPDLPLDLALGAALGLCGGLLLAWLREGLDERVRDAAALERHAGIPVLALVPRVARARARPAGGTAALLPWQDPASPLAEAFRALRTALVFATPAGAPRVLHVTSPAHGEGRTSAACATAIAFAETGSRVLLVDADLRRPALHRVFGLAAGPGLAAGLDEGTAAAALPQASPVPNLWVLTGGTPPAHPAEVLSSPRLGALLDDLAAGFDHLILDGPPVLDLADALLLAHLADASLLVVAAGTTRLPALGATLRRLRTGGAPPLGALLVKARA